MISDVILNELYHELGTLWNLETDEDDEKAIKLLKEFIAMEVIDAVNKNNVRWNEVIEELKLK